MDKKTLDMSDSEIVVRYNQAKEKGKQVKILAELNDCSVERIIDILVANGVDTRKFNRLRGSLKNKADKIPYKKPEIIPKPPKETTPEPAPIEQALAVIRSQIEELNRQQYELDMRKAELYKAIWDMLGEVN